MSKKIVRLTEEDLCSIVKESIKAYLKEANDYGMISNNNVGKQGFQNVKIYNDMRNRLNNDEEVMYNLPIDFDKVFQVNIKPLGNKIFMIYTNYGNKKEVGVDNVLKVINDMYTNALSNSQRQ